MKIRDNVFYLCILIFVTAVFGMSVVADESTEAGAFCIDENVCTDSRFSPLSSLTELTDICPKFTIKQQILRDNVSSLTADSPDEICLKGADHFTSYFENAEELESYIQNNPHFSNLNKESNMPHFSSCLFQSIPISSGLGKTPLYLSTRRLPENKKKLAVAEYYSSLKRLADGVERSLQNITAIDVMIGRPSLLEDISCKNLGAIQNQCQSFKQCSFSQTSDVSTLSPGLRESAQNTLLALQAIEAIDREIRKLTGPRSRTLFQNKDKIQELQERKANIQSLYPWVLGKVFKDGYNSMDYASYSADSSEESKKLFEEQMAGLIENQLIHTRGKLKERKEDLLKASSCIRGDASLCEDLDVPKILAKAPPIDFDEVFERDRKRDLKSKSEEGSLTPEERKEYRRLLTKVGEASALFGRVECLQTQRNSVKEVNKELVLGVSEVGVVIGTMGFGSAVMAGKLALRMGGALSKAQKMSKAKRLQNLGIFGIDVSLSSPYMQEVMSVCEDQMNQLEEIASEENR